LDRATHRAELNAELRQTLAARKSAEWVEVLNRAGVPCGPIYSVDQVFADPQVTHLQAAVGVEHPRLGKLRVLNQAARLSRTPAAVLSATPDPGQHTDEVLAELGYSVAEISALRAKGVV
jgi:formyl-CoA transferase